MAIDQASQMLESAAWSRARPDIAVVVATHRRSSLLADLLDALERQDLDPRRFEVVIVDDGSGDETGDLLRSRVATTPLALRALIREPSTGPSAARNHGVGELRAALVAFTDDDCIPTSGWLTALLATFAATGADVVQGATAPPPGAPRPSPWARTIDIRRPSPLFETCNLAYRRDRFVELGGFDERDPLTALGGGRHFGEDTVLGGRLMAAGGSAAFADDAVVHHRWEPGDFAAFAAMRWRLARFPGLVRRSEHLARSLLFGVFVSRRTLEADAAAAGVLSAVASRRLLPLAAALPWLVSRWPEARWRGAGRPAIVRLGQLAIADAVGLVALVVGSVRHRRVVL